MSHDPDFDNPNRDNSDIDNPDLDDPVGPPGGHTADSKPVVHGVSSSRGYRPLDFAEPSQVWTSSVWWLYVPVALLLGLALWQRMDRAGALTGFDEPSTPDSLAASAVVDGWSARVEESGLALRLEPLHPVAARQAFDASALAARFRGDGRSSSPDAQPWRLTMAVAEGAPSAADVIDDLSAVRIEGLEPLILPARDGASGAETGAAMTDPLATLFRFPKAALHVGETCDLVFWGPRPGKEVVVTAPGLSPAAVLRELARSTSPSSSSIARFDARDKTRSAKENQPR